MGFLQNIFKRRETGGYPVPSTTDPAAPENQPATAGGSFEERIVHVRDPRLALTVAAVYRAVELRAKTEAQFIIQYQKKNPAAGNYTEEAVGNGRILNRLLQMEPNEICTASSLVQQIVIRRLMDGNAFVKIDRDIFGNVSRLYLADSGAGYNRITGTYTLTWLTENGTKMKADVPRSDVLHFPNTFRSDDGFWGISTLRFAYDSLSLIKTEGAQALESAAKGGRMKLIIGEKSEGAGYSAIAKGMFTKAELDKYALELSNKVYKQDVTAMRGVETVNTFSMNNQEMQMLETMNLGLDDVARYFGTPRPLLMLDTNSHYTTYTNATLEYLQRTVQPDVTDMEQELNRKLIPARQFGRYRIHMCEQPLLRLDKEAQAKVDQLQLQTGAATVNEIRQQYDRPWVEGGDEPMASANLMTLKALMAKEHQPAPAPAATEPATEPSATEGEKGGEA